MAQLTVSADFVASLQYTKGESNIQNFRKKIFILIEIHLKILVNFGPHNEKTKWKDILSVMAPSLIFRNVDISTFVVVSKQQQTIINS